MEYEQHDEEMEIPRESGVAGFLEAIRSILKLPRVQNIHINAQGRITYSFFLRKGEKLKAASPNFDAMMPYAIVRNGQVQEILYASSNALEACAQLFERAAADHMAPVAFLTGQGDFLWSWYKESVGREPAVKEELFGFPLVIDSKMESTSLLLCTAYQRGGTITDTVRSYKITIPNLPKPKESL